MTTLLAADRRSTMSLFKNLASRRPATSAELASRTNLLNERYLRVWLAECYGCLSDLTTTELKNALLCLLAEHAAVLAQENGPFFIGGILPRCCQRKPEYSTRL